MARPTITFRDDREELGFLRALSRVSCLVDELLEDCLERSLGLDAALDVLLSHCARLLGATDGFVQIWGSNGPILTRELGSRPLFLQAEEGAWPVPSGTLLVKRLTLGSLQLGSLGLFVPGLPEEDGPAAFALLAAMGEQLDSALLGFVAVADGASPTARLDELAAADRFRPRTRMGRYELLVPLGAGGMAQVFVARQLGPDGVERLVALKRILPHLAREEAVISGFQDEAQIGLRLSHPNLLATYDFGRTPAGYYLAMELVRGVTLNGLLTRAGPLAPHHAVGILVQALRGLHAAHELQGEDGRPLNLVHRDLSPHNLMIGYDGVVKVLDFGIAKIRGGRLATAVGNVKGKPSYMSPEQASCEPLDRRSDLFAAAVVLYEALTGVRPFERGGEVASMTAAVNDNVRRDRRIPDRLWQVLCRAFDKQPASRFGDALELAGALESAVAPASTEKLGERIRNEFPESWRASLGWEAAARAPTPPGD